MGIFEKPTVTITLDRYEKLIRDSERLDMLKDYIETENYIFQGDEYMRKEELKKVLIGKEQ